MKFSNELLLYLGIGIGMAGLLLIILTVIVTQIQGKRIGRLLDKEYGTVEK